MADKRRKRRKRRRGWNRRLIILQGRLPFLPKVDFSLLNDLIVGGGGDEGIRIWRRELACVRLFV